MLFQEFNYTNAVGAGGFLLSLIAYCIIRRINAGGQSPGRLYCNARTCFVVGLLKFGIGVFEITYFNSSGGLWWGWILVLFAIFWMVRGNKYRTQATNSSAGYQAFNDENPSIQQPSSGPQIVIVNEHRNSESGDPCINPSIIHDQVIQNAVPPSPFSGNQGTDTYIVSSVTMAVTSYNIPRSDIARMTQTLTVGNIDTMNEHEEELIDTQPHAEDSIYIESEDEKNIENKEEDVDGKREIEDETPKAPKTAEGNVTFS